MLHWRNAMESTTNPLQHTNNATAQLSELARKQNKNIGMIITFMVQSTLGLCYKIYTIFSNLTDLRSQPRCKQNASACNYCL